jgi:hypothetical protein
MDMPFDEDDDDFLLPIWDDDFAREWFNIADVIQVAMDNGTLQRSPSVYSQAELFVRKIVEESGINGVYMLMGLLEEASGVAIEVVADKQRFEQRVFHETSIYSPELWDRAKSHPYWAIMLDSAQRQINSDMSNLISILTGAQIPFRKRLKLAFKALTKR